MQDTQSEIQDEFELETSETSEDTLSELDVQDTEDSTEDSEEDSEETQDTKDTPSEPSEPSEPSQDLKPKLDKDELRKKSRQKIIDKFTEKFLSGEIDENYLSNPEFKWARDEVIEQATLIRGDQEIVEDRITKLENKLVTEIEQLKSVKQLEQVEKEKQESSKLIKEFMQSNEITLEELRNTPFMTYYNELKASKIPKIKATEYALARLVSEPKAKEVIVSMRKSEMSFAKTGTKPGSLKRLTSKQIEIARKCGNDPTKVY